MPRTEEEDEGTVDRLYGVAPSRLGTVKASVYEEKRDIKCYDLIHSSLACHCAKAAVRSVCSLRVCGPKISRTARR